MLTVGSLFSGIGGLELGLEWAGFGPVLWQVEKSAFCRAVLAKHWPDARRYADVRSVRSAELAPVDVVCGGFPCQDVSLAGAGAGLAGARSGLWFEYYRILADLRPRGVLVENVAGLVRRGLDRVVGGLCELGYTVEGTRIRASDVGFPHRRERVFLVAFRLADADREGQPQPGGDLGERGRRPCDGGLGMADAGVFRDELEPGLPGQAPPSYLARGGAGLADAAGERRPGTGILADGRGECAVVADDPGVGDADWSGQQERQERRPQRQSKPARTDSGVGDTVRAGLEVDRESDPSERAAALGTNGGGGRIAGR